MKLIIMGDDGKVSLSLKIDKAQADTIFEIAETWANGEEVFLL